MIQELFPLKSFQTSKSSFKTNTNLVLGHSKTQNLDCQPNWTNTLPNNLHSSYKMCLQYPFPLKLSNSSIHFENLA